jgi:hypothetical protein
MTEAKSESCNGDGEKADLMIEDFCALEVVEVEAVAAILETAPCESFLLLILLVLQGLLAEGDWQAGRMEADESQLQGILVGNNSPKTAERRCWTRKLVVACGGKKVRFPGGHHVRLTRSGLGRQKA